MKDSYWRATNINRFYVIFVVIFIIQLIFASNQLSGQLNPQNRDNKDEKTLYYHLIEEIKNVDYATQCARNAVTAFADSAFLPDLLFQLSEWEVQREKLQFELAMMKYDLQLQLFESGKLESEPSEPLLTFEETLSINQQLLEKYPHVPYINKVLYRTAICLFEIGQKDSSKKLFERLIIEYPDSSYLADVLFRVGECYFDEGNYEKAIQAYQQILESWQSPFFAMALYKIAWCHYRMNNYSDAISTFYYLLNDIKFMENLNSELLGKSQVQLKEEIMEYITLSFSDFGGASKLFSFIENTGGSTYTPSLLHKLGKIYIKRDFYEDAIDALNLLLTKFPFYEKLPEIFALFWESYEKSGDMNKAYKLHDQIIAYCGPKSKWSQLHKNQKDLAFFDSLLTKIDYKIATPLLNTADSLFATKNYNEAAAKYSYFLKIYREDERSDHVHYCLAECYYNMSEYKKAADTYKSFVFNFPENELQEDAGYNHIICYDQLLKQSNTAWQDSNISIEENEDLKNLINACNDFLKWLPKSHKEPEIKLKLAEIFYQKNMYPMAEKYARSALVSIIKYNRGSEHKINGLNLLAQISFKQGKFKNTEVLASLLIKEKPDSSDIVDRSNKMLASTSFKIGEELKSKGENRLAAFKFEQAAMRSSDPQIAEASLFESAIQFEEAKQFNRAATNFENFYKKYPHSEHAKEAIYRAALLRDKLGQYHLGATDYVLLHELIPNNPEGSAALYNAALAYEKAKDWFSMAETFKKYIAKYPNDNENILEAIFKVAHGYELRNMKQQANTEYQTLLNKYNQLKAGGEFADDYFAAQASFRLAEMKHDHFKSVKLAPPLQVNLKKKQNEFNGLLKSYVDVAKFNIAEWSTAAFYRLGLAYEEFCQDILESPAPPNLKGDDLNTYWKSINQQWIVPLQKEALKYYQTNEKLAAENNLSNEWIEKTRARILFLNKKLAAENNTISSTDQVKEASVNVNSNSPQKRQKL